MRERDKFFAKARRTQNADTWNIAHFCRNQVQMAIKQYKTDFIRRQLQRNKKNPRQFGDNIRELLPNSKDNTIKSLYDQPSHKTIDKNELPMYINSFFTSIGENLARPLLKYKPQTNDVPGADIDLEIQLEQEESLNFSLNRRADIIVIGLRLQNINVCSRIQQPQIGIDTHID